jgi:hypothetical protein
MRGLVNTLTPTGCDVRTFTGETAVVEDTSEQPAKTKKPRAVKPPDDRPLVEALLKVLDGKARPLLTAGKTEGIFPSAAAGKALLKRASEAGYLEACDGPTQPEPPTGKGKKIAKPVAHGRITQAGREWVLSHTSPRQAMEGLLAAFQNQAAALHGTEVDISTLQAQLGDLQHSFRQVQQGIDAVVERRKADVQRVIETMAAVTEHLTRGVEAEKELAAGTAPKVSAVATEGAAELAEEAVAFAKQFRQERGADCPLSDLYVHLKTKSAGLTIGAFHDLLRNLHKQQRLELSGWGGTLDQLPEPELALFISRKVMYYAHALAHG